jgi:hypothetical protein
MIYSDEYRSYHGLAFPHATVNHRQHEWARADDGDGLREVHCNTGEGAGAGLRPFLRTFRGVHKAYLQHYVATYEAARRLDMSHKLYSRVCWRCVLRTSTHLGMVYSTPSIHRRDHPLQPRIGCIMNVWHRYPVMSRT